MNQKVPSVDVENPQFNDAGSFVETRLDREIKGEFAVRYFDNKTEISRLRIPRKAQTISIRNDEVRLRLA